MNKTNSLDQRTFFQKIDWVNTLFLTLTPVCALAGMGYVFAEGLLKWQTVVLFLVMTMLTGLSITAGYHRLFAHKSYEASWPVRVICLMFGAAAFQNSAIKWSSDHRVHHQFVDTERDPYNIKRGFLYAHILWIMEKPFPARKYDNVPDLRASWWMRFQNRYIFTLGVIFGFIFPTAVASLWGDPLGGLFLAGFTRIVMNHHFTFFINSLCHMWGARTYAETESARDNWVLSLFTYGEGYHNFHHTFPADYRNGIRPYHWDPTKWAIWSLQCLDLARNLRRVSEKNTVTSRLRIQENRLVEIWRARKGFAHQEFQQRVTATRERFEQAQLRFIELKSEYKRLKKQKIDDFHGNYLKLKSDLTEARKRLEESAQAWAQLCRVAVAI